MIRRALLTVLVLLAVPASAHAATAWVTVGSFRTMSIDPATGRRSEPIDVGGSMLVTPDNKTVYVHGSHVKALPIGVWPLDTATNTVGAMIPLPAGSNSMAITPDGGTLLVSNAQENIVTPVATATNLPGTPIAVNGPGALAITPDGRTAYVVTRGNMLTPIDLTTNTVRAPIALAHLVAAIRITPDGTLAVISESGGAAGYVQVVDLASGVPEAAVQVVADQPGGDLVIAPDGATAYVVAGSISGPPPFRSVPLKHAAVYPFTIATRTVGPKLGHPGASSGISQLTISADGGHLYEVQPCTIGGHCPFGFVTTTLIAAGTGAKGLYDGTVGPVIGAPTSMTLGPSPAAAFTVDAGTTGQPTTFDGGASHNDGGSTTSYAWDFGDGTSETTSAASTRHIYHNPGTYTVKLATTNAGGCAAKLVYTGRSALCSGSPTATTTRRVTVITPGAPATTARPGAIKATAATLKGTVGDTGGAVGWHFEYGATSHTLKTPTRRGTGQVEYTIKRLKPNTTYHYRLVTDTDRGTPPFMYGADMTFKTATTGTLRLQAKTLRLRRRSVNVALRCQSSVACRGSLTLTSGKRTCATATFNLKANARSTKRLTVRSTCRKTTSAKLTSTVTTGQKTFAATVRIKR